MTTLLIANRGEIARRVIGTARRLGWYTVAIHTALDGDALHVRDADHSVLVESYLDIDAVVAAARGVGADFVHPGYGFLSERAPFARALTEAGIGLVGPSPEVMDAMGRKDAARTYALSAQVPVVPSYKLDDDPESLDYPVLVKAAAGGGGKGMRVVRSAAELGEAKAAAAREAAASFGDDTLLIEKYVESGRHIEVQVMGDSHGNLMHFFERDCSTQRRHQKVLEEAPAPTISPAQRAAITSSAVALALQVGYTNAGTVEFLLDNATGEFYFLEMNTRLQVEHPVTEEVVRVRGERIDLVEIQLRVAAGEALDVNQDEVTLDGHAIEARVYAEDSFNGFLPQAGVATFVAWGGTADQQVRLDHALASGQEVSTSFDPMLGKVIGSGPDRDAARRALIGALRETVILGLTTNCGFLHDLLCHPAFADATIDTAWLDRTEIEPPDPEPATRLAAALLAPSCDASPWLSDGWRSGGQPSAARVSVDGQWLEVPTHRRSLVPTRGDSPGKRNITRIDLIAEGPPVHGVGAVAAHQIEVVHHAQRFVFERPDPFADAASEVGDGAVRAPMPGTVLAVNVSVGQVVAEGETLGVMEAMKMELALKAPFAGTLTEVGPTVGDLVKLGASLFVVEPLEPSDG